MVGFTINDHRIRPQLRYSPNLNCYSVRFNAAFKPNSVARRTVFWIEETKLIEERRYQLIAILALWLINQSSILLCLRAALNLLWEIMLSGIVKKYIMIKIANAIQVSVSTQAINNPAITNKGITIFLGSLLPLKEKVGMLLTINSPTKTNQAEIK